MLINNIESSKIYTYYNEWYDKTGWNSRSESSTNPPVSPTPPIIGTNNENSPETPESPPVKNLTVHHKMFFEFLKILLFLIQERLNQRAKI